MDLRKNETALDYQSKKKKKKKNRSFFHKAEDIYPFRDWRESDTTYRGL